MANIREFVDEIYEKRHKKLIAQFHRRFKVFGVSESDVEDIFQQVIMYMLEKKDLDFEIEAEAFVYLRRGMYCRMNNHISRYLLKHKFIGGILPLVGEVEPASHDGYKVLGEVKDFFNEAVTTGDEHTSYGVSLGDVIGSLPKVLNYLETEIFEMRYYDEMTIRDIAYELKIGHRTVSDRLRKITKKLRKEHLYEH